MQILGRRFSLQTKVMVLAAGALLMVLTAVLVFVDRELKMQAGRDAAQMMAITRGALVRSLQASADELRFRLVASSRDQRFLRIMRLKDAPTMREYLRQSMLEELGADTAAVVFITTSGDTISARPSGGRGAPAALETFIESLVMKAFQGEESGAVAVLEGAPYQVVAVPCQPPEGMAGVIVIAARVSDSRLREICPPACALLLMGDGAVLAASFAGSGERAEVGSRLLNRGVDPWVRWQGQRWEAVAGDWQEASLGSSLRYFLLVSVEARLSAVESSQRVLLGVVILAGVSVGSLAWVLLSRLIRPLRQLRDEAEAVGRGDFSRRISQFSSDECGDLALAFNQMAGSLEVSRTELDRAMTKLQSAQVQLVQGEKISALGQFVAGMVNELSIPLRNLIGVSSVTFGRLNDAEKRLKIDLIVKSAERCRLVVEKLRDFASPPAHLRRLLSVGNLLRDTLKALDLEMRSRRVSVLPIFSAELPLIEANGEQLQQAITNILDNALHALAAVDRPRTITVNAMRGLGVVKIEIEDNGSGIIPEHLHRVFEPFFTGDPEKKRSGLGLSVSHGVVTGHGGRIAVSSVLGEGSTFTITLPVAAGDATEQQIARQENYLAILSHAAPRGAHRRVLVIDDDPWIRSQAEEFLCAESYLVMTAAEPAAALELIKEHNFSVVVIDLQMPQMTGSKLYEQARVLRPDLRSRVLFMSGSEGREPFQAFLGANGFTCLFKPIAKGEFLAAVKRRAAIVL